MLYVCAGITPQSIVLSRILEPPLLPFESLMFVFYPGLVEPLWAHVPVTKDLIAEETNGDEIEPELLSRVYDPSTLQLVPGTETPLPSAEKDRDAYFEKLHELISREITMTTEQSPLATVEYIH